MNNSRKEHENFKYKVKTNLDKIALVFYLESLKQFFGKPIEEIDRCLYVWAKYMSGGNFVQSPSVRISNMYGDEFVFRVSLGKIYLYDHTGATMVMNICENVFTKETYELIEETTNEWSRGIVKCADCNEKIRKDEVAGRYYAGLYCKKCWEETWKEKESREKYD